MTNPQQQDPGTELPSFIQVYPEVLSRSECADIIARFEADDRKTSSWSQRSAAPRDRSGTMLKIPDYEDWQDVVQRVGTAVMQRIQHYATLYPAFANVLKHGNCQLTHPLLERIEPGQGFDWHIDGSTISTERRVLSTILYLADIDEGGETQFAYQGVAVKPTAGSLVIFPPFWTHLHRGDTPRAGVKYNLTNFVVLRPRDG